jgi:hypothetical protein
MQLPHWLLLEASALGTVRQQQQLLLLHSLRQQLLLQSLRQLLPVLL